MAIVQRSRGAQWPLVAEFVFNYTDGFAPLPALNSLSQVNSPKVGVTDFGSKVQPQGVLSGVVYTANDNASTKYFECLALPLGAQVLSGEMVIEQPFIGPSTATIALGNDHGSALYMAATSLIAGALGNSATVSSITNAGTDPNVMTVTASASNHSVVAGDLLQITGCTGASALYNGSFVVVSVASAAIVVNNPSLTVSLTTAGSPAAKYLHQGRTAITIPAQESYAGGQSYTTQTGQEGALGVDIRGTMVMSGGQTVTAGRVRFRVMYSIDGRVNEVSTT